MLKTNLKWNLGSRLVGAGLALVLAIVLTSCDSLSERLSQRPTTTTPPPPPTPTVDRALSATSGSLFEVNTPAAIARLAPALAKYQPQVKILSPKFDEVLTDDSVTVKLQVDNLPLFKSALGLGNHLHAILDKQAYQGVYDLNQPLVLKNLAPGTHTLRVFASRPWHESFKNQGAYDIVTFHVLTKTAENNPDPQKPLLTYSRPAGTYGAEPIMLDYYLTNAPSHPASDRSTERIPDWRIRVTINDQRFILDRWAPLYLQGFKRGKNLVRMELVDDRGNPIPNVYNDNISFFTYDPQQQDPLAKLVTGELEPDLALALVDPSHIANKPAPTPTVATVPNLTTPTPTATPIPGTSAKPTFAGEPEVIAGKTANQTEDRPLAKPAPSAIAPAPQPTVAPITSVPSPPAPTQQPLAKPVPSEIAVAPVPKPEVAANAQGNQIDRQPLAKPAPSAIVPTTQPTLTPINPVAPSPAPQPSIAPAQQPIEIAPTPPTSNVPAPSQEPIASSAQSVPPAITNSIPPSPLSTPSSLSPPSPQIENPHAATWQTKAIELFDAGRAKIRQFTNTMPSKAQRFARNLKTWTGYAIDKIQEFRASQDRGNAT